MTAIRSENVIWKTLDGQTLVEYSGGKTAYVESNSLNAQHLRDLSDACMAAAMLISAEQSKEVA